MKQPTVLVIDIATTLVKVSLFDFRCRLVDKISCPHNKSGLGNSFGAETCWQAVVTCSSQLSARRDVAPSSPLHSRWRSCDTSCCRSDADTGSFQKPPLRY